MVHGIFLYLWDEDTEIQLWDLFGSFYRHFFISSAYVSIKAMPVSMAFYEIFLLRSIVVLTVAICLVAATKLRLRRMNRHFSSLVLCAESELEHQYFGCSAYSSFYGSDAPIHGAIVSRTLGVRLVPVQRQKDSLMLFVF